MRSFFSSRCGGGGGGERFTRSKAGRPRPQCQFAATPSTHIWCTTGRGAPQAPRWRSRSPRPHLEDAQSADRVSIRGAGVNVNVLLLAAVALVTDGRIEVRPLFSSGDDHAACTDSQQGSSAVGAARSLMCAGSWHMQGAPSPRLLPLCDAWSSWAAASRTAARAQLLRPGTAPRRHD